MRSLTVGQGSVMKLPVVRTTLGLPDMAAIAAANKVNTTAEVVATSLPSVIFAVYASEQPI